MNEPAVPTDHSVKQSEPRAKFDWWAAAVAATWAAMVALCIWYTIAYGRNMPTQDEWEFIPVLVGQAPGVDWVVTPHNEHRYALGRAIYLTLHRLTGNWFPAGMAISVSIMAVAATLLSRLARRIRGRFHPLDLWYSVLLLSLGHHENFLMGYQIVFTLTTLVVAVFIGLPVWLQNGNRKIQIAVAGSLLVLLALSGGLGLAILIPISAWLAYVVVRALREGERLGGLSLSLVPAVIALVLASRAAFGGATSQSFDVSNNAEDTVYHATEFLSVGFGSSSVFLWPPMRNLIAIVEACTALGLFVIAVRRPAERSIALAWLAVLVGIALAGLAVGHTRVSGFGSRYMCISCLGPCICLLAATRYLHAPRTSLLVLGLVGIPFAGLASFWNLEAAQGYGWAYQVRASALKADIRDRVPITFVADRNVLFPIGSYRANFRLLRDSGFRPLAGIPDDPPLRSTRLLLPQGSGFPAWHPSESSLPPKQVLPTPGRFVSGLRITYRSLEPSFWQKYVLRWVSLDGSTHFQEVFPWVTSLETTTSYWIADHPTTIWLEPGDPTVGMVALAVEYFFSE